MNLLKKGWHINQVPITSDKINTKQIYSNYKFMQNNMNNKIISIFQILVNSSFAFMGFILSKEPAIRLFFFIFFWLFLLTFCLLCNIFTYYSGVFSGIKIIICKYNKIKYNMRIFCYYAVICTEIYIRFKGIDPTRQSWYRRNRFFSVSSLTEYSPCG
jgi:hypothetical protein